MTTEGMYHTLVDLDDDPSGEIAMIYNYIKGVVFVRKLNRYGIWQDHELAFALPDPPPGDQFWFSSDIDFTGAISLWPDGTRYLMLFYCYETSPTYALDTIEGPWWRMANIKNLGW